MSAALTAPTRIAAAQNNKTECMVKRLCVLETGFHTMICYNTDFILIHLRNEKVFGAFKYLEKP